MNIFILVLSHIMGLIFLTSSIDKILKYKEFILDIQNYKIVPKNLEKIFAIIMIISQLFCAFNFIFNQMKYINLGIALTLMFCFTIAIIINLFRNNKINCGCGGVVGDKQISWSTVARNLVLIFMMFVILLNSPKSIEFSSNLVIFFNITIIYGIIKVYSKYKFVLNTY
ncbi:MauE/DoxX family redox-associated membrane protein [Heyndrickxia sporothermodurans]|uniref:Methylamine utilisation protein MauE domain-containing protein n=1 Tax=Heyndrickxia sporothermodurans TaxID=46224 RepID=A0AB37HFU0_9BACI|nr:MauE/DoxX family redox-associated membrane protein [Heyndrickxia sporothermodurans]MBL5772794.1 hypothetical protein [Heyndrickxia sporothermodurans]MBL5776216.1 hypothetical protein [Heyndrickxia sporothermodurans]MBL5790499.1 hypothetical protein [Heyndrickxia sporothermodurans]MBL5793861.1 hypothetical protein [Heyndrickxia sporothermodurans]MBL5797716.1 hypothetical protein [Heyndrickxia sporothermodurans]